MTVARATQGDGSRGRLDSITYRAAVLHGRFALVGEDNHFKNPPPARGHGRSLVTSPPWGGEPAEALGITGLNHL